MTAEIINKICIKADMNNVWELLSEGLPTFFLDPASTRYNRNHEGGLADHSLGVFLNLYNLYKGFDDSVKWESLFKIAMLHDTCKVGTYQAVTKSKRAMNDDGTYAKNHNGGAIWDPYIGYDKVRPEGPILGHSDQSLYIAIQAGINLSENEIMAIRWHMGSYDNHKGEDSYRMRDAMEKSQLVTITQTADALDAFSALSHEDLMTEANKFMEEHGI